MTRTCLNKRRDYIELVEDDLLPLLVFFFPVPSPPSEMGYTFRFTSSMCSMLGQCVDSSPLEATSSTRRLISSICMCTSLPPTTEKFAAVIGNAYGQRFLISMMAPATSGVTTTVLLRLACAAILTITSMTGFLVCSGTALGSPCKRASTILLYPGLSAATVRRGSNEGSVIGVVHARSSPNTVVRTSVVSIFSSRDTLFCSS